MKNEVRGLARSRILLFVGSCGAAGDSPRSGLRNQGSSTNAVRGDICDFNAVKDFFLGFLATGPSVPIAWSSGPGHWVARVPQPQSATTLSILSSENARYR